MSSFFKRKPGGQKRKLGQKRKQDSNAPKRSKKAKDDDEILSSEDEENGELTEGKHKPKDLSDEEEIFEDPKAKSERETKRILQQLEVSIYIHFIFKNCILKTAAKPADKGDEELTDEDLDAIAHRIKKEEARRVVRRVADNAVIDEESTLTYRPHKLSPVCVAISNDGRFVVSCSKDGSIVKCEF